MPPGRGNTVIYGKITLSSEIESMDSICTHLSDILKEHGYPNDSAVKTKEEETNQKDVEEAENKLKQMMLNGAENT
jgi:hypothetical protein